MFERIRLLLRISRSQDIARRYLVTNGFDGALAMLGLVLGFYVSGAPVGPTVLSACLGVALALLMSGLSSAYVSEAAERRRELRQLERAMLTDLDESAHALAARYVPLLIAAVNGLAPFLIALLIMLPLALAVRRVPLPFPPLEAAIGVALAVIFLLGAFLGRISGIFWLWSALRTLATALVTMALILLLSA